eukprot:2802784-Amphidinium_carterae.1
MPRSTKQANGGVTALQGVVIGKTVASQRLDIFALVAWTAWDVNTESSDEQHGVVSSLKASNKEQNVRRFSAALRVACAQAFIETHSSTQL